MKKINFLPTKFRYIDKERQIEMYYRKANDNKLYKVNVDFDHYIYVSPAYRKYGKTDESNMLYRLTDEEPLISAYMTQKSARDLYKSEQYETGEADVSAKQRFVCDTFYNIDFPADIQPRLFYLDIETYSNDGKLPRFNHNIAEINAITIFDNYTKKFYSWFLVPSTEKRKFNECYEKIKKEIEEYGDNDIKLFMNAKSLLMSFIQFLITECPDIITAWNSPFDIPYIVRKIIDHFGIKTLKEISPFKDISFRVSGALENNTELKDDNIIPGIDVIDMMEWYKKRTPGQKPSYSLKAITEEELTETKLMANDGDADPNHMYVNDFINFCKYNVQDVRLLCMLEEKRRILQLAITMRNTCKTDFQDVFHASTLIDYLFLMEAVSRRHNGWKYVLPSRRINPPKVKILGAFVKESIVGRWPWIADLDFSSLYPSVVKTFNLSNESVVGIVNHEQLLTLIGIAKTFKFTDLEYVKNNILPKYLNSDAEVEYYATQKIKESDIRNLGEELDITVEYYPRYAKDNSEITFKGMKEFVKWLKDNNFVFLPNGVIVDQNKTDAIVAKIIADLMSGRQKYKKIMLEYSAKGDTENEDRYNTYQLAMKEINNSVYGSMKMEGFRMANAQIAEAITTSGQLLIRTSTHCANQFLNDESNTSNVDYVLANDTDSIIFTLRGIVNESVDTRDPDKLAEIAEYSKKCQDYVNEAIFDIVKNLFYKYKVTKTNNFLNVKNEWLASAGLFVAKKMYVIQMVFKEGIAKEKLASTGISLKRASTPAVLKPFIENVVRNILAFKDKNEIDKLIIDECDKLNSIYDISDIAIPISLGDVSSYEGIPVHVRGINIWNNYFAPTERDKLNSGKVKYLYVKQWENMELNLNKEYVISVPSVNRYWDYVKGKITVDYDKMKERLILKPIDAFYHAVNWSLPLQTRVVYNTLFDKF